jgi:hypothetical protein
MTIRNVSGLVYRFYEQNSILLGALAEKRSHA